MRMALMTLFLLCAASPRAIAADNEGNYAVWGKGKKACFTYSKARQQNDIGDYKNYIMGYLTATNIILEKTYSISGKMKLEEILDWMDEYCEDNPLSSYEGALTEFSLRHFETRSSSGTRASW